MSNRYQFFRNPKTTVYETPAQAYMIIDGISETYKIQKSKRNRYSGSSCCQQRHYSKIPKKRAQHKCQQRQNDKKQERLRLQSCDRHFNKQRRKLNEALNNQYQQRYDYSNNDCNFGQSPVQLKGRIVSFRSLDLTDQQRRINCQFPKQLEKQNIELRKENKMLQGYVKVLENQCKNLNENQFKPQLTLRTTETPFTIKNNFTLKNIVDSAEKNCQSAEFLVNKMHSTKGQSQQYSYIN